MKTHHIKNNNNVTVQISIDGKKKYTYKIPAIKSNSILKSLEQYKEKNIDLDKTDIYKKRLSEIGSNPKYQKSALMVKTARQKKRLTQKILAEKINIERTNLIHIEKARRPVGKELAKKFSKILDIDYRIFIS